MDQRFIEYSRQNAERDNSSIFEHLTKGEIVVIRNAHEIHNLNKMIVSGVKENCGTQSANEIHNWITSSKAPTIDACVCLANVLLELKNVFALPVLMMDFIKSLNLSGPVSVEGGAPRLNLPASLETQFTNQANKLNPAILKDFGDDPSRHVMLMAAQSQRPHRDIGRPHTAFMTNVWCALQDIDKHQALILFPDAYKDPSHDFDEYAWNKSEDPADWGFGAPLQISMRAGDVVLFHSDHYHSSPVTTSDNLRLSWEFRVVSQCYDDMGWYRLGFKLLNNFSVNGKMDSKHNALEHLQNIYSKRNMGLPSLHSYLRTEPERISGHQILDWLINQPQLDEDFFVEALEAMFNLPFAEDRFLWPLFAAQKTFPNLHLDKLILEFVITRTKNYYWACVFGGLALGADETALSKSAFTAARKYAKLTKTTCDLNPVNYFTALTQSKSSLLPILYHITPQDVDEVIRLYEEGHIKKGLNGSTVDLVKGSPHPKGMFRPCYPFIEPVPSCSSNENTLFERFINYLLRRQNEEITPLPKRKLQAGSHWLTF